VDLTPLFAPFLRFPEKRASKGRFRSRFKIHAHFWEQHETSSAVCFYRPERFRTCKGGRRRIWLYSFVFPVFPSLAGATGALSLFLYRSTREVRNPVLV
jgi:hypothetical protein